MTSRIGGISKTDLKRFIAWAEKNFDLPILESFLTAIPTAELEPITKDYVQSDGMCALAAHLTTCSEILALKIEPHPILED